MGLKNNSEDGRDLMSYLPDSVRIQILSLLNMRDAIKTSLLSKRWRYLWMYTFNLDFDVCLPEQTGNGDRDNASLLKESAYIASFIDMTLILHEAAEIERFHVSFFYDNTRASQVDTWILYATRHRVKELYLDFFSGIWSDWKTHCLYDLPHFILSSESLEVLTLKCCRLIRPSSMCFGSLKSLNLQQMMLHDGMIENVISYCPLLENLGIKDCNTEIDLSIKTDRGIKSLMIEDISLVPSSNAVLLIHAPKLLYLEFKGNYPRAEYRISNLQSLVAVSIHFGDILCKDNDKLEVGHCDTVKKLLDDLCHVKHVKLCCQCLQVLAFRKLRCLDNPLCNITCLELKTGLRKLKLPGIAYLLKSCCPNLDIFVLRIDEKLPIQSKYADWLDDQGVHIDEGGNAGTS